MGICRCIAESLGYTPETNTTLKSIMCVSCFSHVGFFATPWTVTQQDSSVHGILQARILEWVAVPSSRGSSQPRDQTHTSYVSCIGRWVLYH